MKIPLIIIFGMLIAAPFAIAGELHQIDNNLYSSGEESMVINAEDAEWIEVNSTEFLSGEINIDTDTLNQIIIKYRKFIKSESSSQADEFSDAIKISHIKNGERIIINFQTPNPAPWSGSENSGRLKTELIIPENSRIRLGLPYFEVEGSGPFKEFISGLSFGSFKVRDVSEFTDITNRSRMVSLYRVAGEVNVQANNADLKITNMITKDIPAKIRNNQGNITLKKISGPLDVRNEYGKIRISDFEPGNSNSEIIGVHSPIRIDLVSLKDSYLEVRNDQESVDLTVPANADSKFDFEVKSPGEIHVRDVRIVPELITDERLVAVSGSPKSTIFVNIEGGGDINIEGESD